MSLSRLSTAALNCVRIGLIARKAARVGSASHYFVSSSCNCWIVWYCPQRLHQLFGRLEYRLQSLPLVQRLHRDVSVHALSSNRLAALGTSTRLATVPVPFARASRGASRRASAALVGAFPADRPAPVVAVATILAPPVFVPLGIPCSRSTTWVATLAVGALSPSSDC